MLAYGYTYREMAFYHMKVAYAHHHYHHHYLIRNRETTTTTPSSSATSILHNKTLSHLAHDPHQSLRHASSPSFSSRALLLQSNPPPPPAPLPSVATSLSMISSAMGHSKQLSTPITLGSSNAFKSISLNSTPIRNLSAFPPTNQLPSHSFLNQIHNANHPTPTNPLLLGRSMTPSADMLLLRSSATLPHLEYCSE